MDYTDYKNKIDVLDDIYYREFMIKRAMGKT